MLKSLKFSVQFKNADGTNGFGCNRSIDFEEGMTAITGRNGQGKSLVLEMIQFAFFGINALRGKSEDYKDLKVDLECWIKGKPYAIARTITKAALFEGHGIPSIQIASSTKAVNQAIRDIFGYSMAVFQVANAINQKQVDRFCAMLPTERKKLVDETIGLSALDGLVKWIGEKETALRAQIAAHTGLLREPVVPVRPEKYQCSFDIYETLELLKAMRRGRDLAAARANQVVILPTEVRLEEDDAHLPEYQNQQEKYAALLTEAILLDKDFKALGTVQSVVAACLEDDDDKLEQYRTVLAVRQEGITRRTELARQLNSIPVTPYTAERLDQAQAQNLARRRWLDKQALLNAGISYHCSECGHDGHMHDPRVEREFGDVPEAEPEGSVLSDDTIIRQRNILERAPERDALWKRIEELDADIAAVDDPSSRIEAIEAARKRVQAQQENLQKQRRHAELTARREDLGARLLANPTTQPAIDRVMQKRHAFSLYQQALNLAQQKQAEIDEAKAHLATFRESLDEEIRSLEKSRDDSIIYETNLKHYETALEAYDNLKAQIATLEAELLDWSNGKQSVADLRTRVKAFLLPSLNRVATYLLQEFSAGQHQWLVVNDDFEVLVDGKRVEVMNGAGKTVVNLAIRIGLGQVLTNQVFPVLMADEPDESCDEIRAAAIEKTLGVLRQKMKQVILVTHKTGNSADHLINFA